MISYCNILSLGDAHMTYVWMKWVIVDLGKDFLPVEHQAITWTNDDLLLIGN